MAYIDTTYVDAMLGEDLRQALYTDGGTYDNTRFAQGCAAATARVRAALYGAGYTAPTDAELVTMASGTDAQKGDAEMVKLAAFGVLVLYAGPLRKQWVVPESILSTTEVISKIESGAVAFATLPLHEGAAVGGVEFSDNDSNSANNYAPIFSRFMGR